VKETGQYARHAHHQHETIIKVEAQLNGGGIPATQNLLTNENHCSIASHP
jgi:hypothetical protein